MGGAVKKKAVRKMIRKENLDFLCIQETKLDHIDHKLCSSLWYDCDVDWGFQPSVGNSGGLLSIWRNDRFHKVSSFYGKGYLGVTGNFCI
ncbi:putative endonuclease/exonuclease/phosphatase [Lupinus albus]|uniref:Putative endonuclease/exonuclease/phosphatase n=1 Tax=Lupinus albus TaxID=3870 RepID=A0A6A4PMW6_LUPAL|nr:putative endonuclease/exonuclease/phosphatase [Lupinus albus]